jgi:ribosomal-protein-alanine N-acetyltransferase
MLLISTIELAALQKARVVTLEVRASNSVAQNLYTKYGFKRVGLRKAYYTDNKEDAFIMTTDVITSPAYSQQFNELKSSHTKKFDGLDYQLQS